MSEEAIQLDPQVQENQTETPKRRSRKAVVYTGFGGFLLFLFVITVFFYYNFKTIEVQGDSMETTLREGQRLLISNAYWLVGPIKDNDIVVIKNPYEGNEVIIKRVYKVAGEVVGLANVPENWDITNGPYTVPKGTIFVLGDNRAVSQDSRHYGPFDIDDVVGKVVVVHSALDE
jgi:signal peptidase I